MSQPQLGQPKLFKKIVVLTIQISLFFWEIINGTPVFLHFIFGSLLFFRLSMVRSTFHTNYNLDIIQVFAVILPFIFEFDLTMVSLYLVPQVPPAVTNR